MQRVRALERRREHLAGRIEQNRLLGKTYTYDMAELSALDWAIPMLRGFVESNRVLHEQLREARDEAQD